MLLAQLIVEQLEQEFGRRGRLKQLTGAMLRETRMPAVQVEPVYDPGKDRLTLLSDPSFSERVGRAVARGLRDFFTG